MPGERTNGDAVDIIENEGLDYAVRHYISGDEFKDPETAKRWKLADKTLTDLCEYLARETGREVG
jgi:hypothetical protein